MLAAAEKSKAQSPTMGGLAVGAVAAVSGAYTPSTAWMGSLSPVFVPTSVAEECKWRRVPVASEANW